MPGPGKADHGRQAWTRQAAAADFIISDQPMRVLHPDEEAAAAAGSGSAASAEPRAAAAGANDYLDGTDSEPETDTLSIPGDSASEAGEPADARTQRRERRLAPQPIVEQRRERGPSSRNNKEPEVGNFGIFFGNWGQRATLGGAEAQRKRTETSDRQILHCPCQVLVMAEANQDIEELLQQPPAPGRTEVNSGDEGAAAAGLERRPTYEHFVVRGKEQFALLIAARKDNTHAVELLHHEVHDDHEYTQKKKKCVARTRMLVCNVAFKQNVGHLGKDIVICAVHGNCRTMKMEFGIGIWNEFFDRLAEHINKYRVKFVAGDFNMALTEVPKQLRSRGITCDCVAWYPWQHSLKTNCETGMQRLGFDSCAIFYIGGGASIQRPWDVDHIPVLARAAGDEEGLDIYEGANCPGQHWSCYRFKTNQKKEESDPKARLHDLLDRSTDEEELSRMPRGEKHFCPFLRLKQKNMEQKEWLVDGTEMHNGAHFPLCMFTQNARARSTEKAMERAEKQRSRVDKARHKTRFETWSNKNGQQWSTAAADKSAYYRNHYRIEKDRAAAAGSEHYRKPSDASNSTSSDLSWTQPWYLHPRDGFREPSPKGKFAVSTSSSWEKWAQGERRARSQDRHSGHQGSADSSWENWTPTTQSQGGGRGRRPGVQTQEDWEEWLGRNS